MREVCARWELPCTAIGEVTDSGALRAFYDGEVVGEIPARLLTDECPRYEVEQQPRTARPRAVARAAGVRRRSVDLSSSTTTSSARAPSAGPGSTPPCCACGRRCAGSPSRSQGPAPGETRPFRAGRRRRSSAPRATSPAPAASRSASPTASTSATPRSRRSRWELAQAIEGIAQAAEALGIPVVSGNVSLYNETGRRARSRRRRSSAASGSCRTCARDPGALAARRRGPARTRPTARWRPRRR